jgi:hypothetical protein
MIFNSLSDSVVFNGTHDTAFIYHSGASAGRPNIEIYEKVSE